MCIVLKLCFHFALLVLYLFRTEHPYCLCSIYMYLVVSDTLKQQITHVLKKRKTLKIDTTINIIGHSLWLHA